MVLVLDAALDRAGMVAASGRFDPTPARIESVAEDGRRGMENALRAPSQRIVREQHQQQSRGQQDAIIAMAMLEIRPRGKAGVLARKMWPAPLHRPHGVGRSR